MGILLLSPPLPPTPPNDDVDFVFARFADGATTVTHQYRTDIHVSQGGFERRHALQTYAREVVRADFMLDDPDTFRQLRKLRTWNPADPVMVPLPWEGVPVVADITGTSVVVDATYLDLRGYNRVLIEGPGGTSYQGVIQSESGAVEAYTIVLDVAPPQTFPALASHLVPLRPFYFDDRSAVGRYQVNAGRWSVTFRQVGPSPNEPDSVMIEPTEYDGLPVLDRRPFVRGVGAEDQPDGAVDRLTNGTNLQPEWSRGAVGAAIYRSHTYDISDTEDYRYFSSLGHVLVGRQKAFLLPTWQADLPVTAVVTDTITVDDDGDYANFWFSSLAHRRVQVTFADGSIGYRIVESASEVGGNSVLVLDSNVDAQAISLVSFLETVRLAEDTLDFEFNSSLQGTITLGFVVVQQ